MIRIGWYDEDLVGHAQIVDAGDGDVELKSIAVVDVMRGRNIGRALVEEALAVAASGGAARMLVATAAADIGNLRFYQRCGFRFVAVDRDAFTDDTGYPAQEVIDGIPLRDRVWFDQPLMCAGEQPGRTVSRCRCRNPHRRPLPTSQGPRWPRS